MIIGETIVAVDTGAQNATTVYTPWIAGWGNSAIFSFEILQMGGAVNQFSVEIFTKNSEDADPGTQKGSTNSQTAPGTYSITDATGLLELVRMKITLTPRANGNLNTAFAHFRPLNPSWKTN